MEGAEISKDGEGRERMVEIQLQLETPVGSRRSLYRIIGLRDTLIFIEPNNKTENNSTRREAEDDDYDPIQFSKKVKSLR